MDNVGHFTVAVTELEVMIMTRTQPSPVWRLWPEERGWTRECRVAR